MTTQFFGITTRIIDGVCKNKLTPYKGGPIPGVPYEKSEHIVYIPAFGDKAAWQECTFDTSISLLPPLCRLDTSYDQVAANDNPPKSGLSNRVRTIEPGFRIIGCAFVDFNNPSPSLEAGIIGLTYQKALHHLVVNVYAAPGAAYGYQVQMVLKCGPPLPPSDHA
jgi:hypothetical protein